WLRTLPFVEALPERRYRVRPFLRLLLPDRLRREPARQQDQLRPRLTEIHSNVMDANAQQVFNDAQGRGYRSWLTLEDRREQERQIEFVYHSLRTERGAFDLARVYLEAFWWWGAYVESAFCRRLLEAADELLVSWKLEATPEESELLAKSEQMV